MRLAVALFGVLFSICAQEVRVERNCDVLQPFRVSPDGAKYLLGGVFPLHMPDCATIRADAVQELMAVQWALSHWNLSPDHKDSKIALYAGNSCSQPNISVSQMIGFLTESGKFKNPDCQRQRIPEPLGLLLPSDDASTDKLASQLEALDVLAISYNTGSSTSYPQAISIAPRLADFLEVALQLLSSLQSNYFATLVNPAYSATVRAALSKRLQQDDEFIASDELSTTDDQLPARLRRTDVNAVLCFVTKSDIYDLLQLRSIAGVRKLLIFIPVAGDVLSEREMNWLSPEITDATVIMLQHHASELPTFRQYFLDILSSNYHAYPLLSSYMRQMYNCSLDKQVPGTPCSQLSRGDLSQKFEQSPNVEAAVLATYAMASLSMVGKLCQAGPGGMCNSESVGQYISYQFSEFDPSEFHGFRIRFDEAGRLEGMLIDGLQIVHDSLLGTRVIKVLEAPTGRAEYHFEPAAISWPLNQRYTSVCPKFKPQCRTCPTTTIEIPYKLHRLGDLYLVGMFNWHKKSRDKGERCGPIKSPRDILGPITFIYALETVKERYAGLDLLPNVGIGALLLDSCDSTYSLFQPISDQESKCAIVPNYRDKLNTTISPESVVGYLSGGSSEEFGVLKDLFSFDGVSVPLGTSVSDKLPNYYKTFSNMPYYEWQAKALIELLAFYRWNYVSVLLSDTDRGSVSAFEAFRAVMAQSDVCIADIIRLQNSRASRIETVVPVSARVVLVFSTAADTYDYVRAVQQKFNADGQYVYILLGDSHNWDSSHLSRPDEPWRLAMYGALSLQPKLPLVTRELKMFIATLTPQKLPEPWFLEFWEDYFGCSLPNGPKKHAYLCEGTETFPSELIGRLTDQSYLVSALELLLFSLDGMYKKFCPMQAGLCEAFYEKYKEELRSMLSDVPRQSAFQLYSYRPISRSAGYLEIGNWTEAEGLSIGEPYVGFVDGTEIFSPPDSSCRLPLCRCELDDDFFSRPMDHQADYVQKGVQAKDIQMADLLTAQKSWNQRTWSYIFIIISGILLLCAVSVLALIVAKLCSRSIAGNQSLGICLLCGVILLYVTSFFFIFDPSEGLCRLRYMGHSFAYVICFGVMIAKATQLRNGETLGKNGYISYWNYWLLLFFVVCVQIALNLQWAMFRQPAMVTMVTPDQSMVYKCAWNADEFLLAQVYIIALLFLALFIAIISRNVKRNYQEARWLMYTTGICIPVWVTWMVAYAHLPFHFRDTVVVMELLTCATVIMCFMFGPKLYILLSYEPILVDITGQPAPIPVYTPGSLGFEKGTSDEDSSSNGSIVAPSTKSSVVAGSVTGKEGGKVYAAVVRKKSRSRKSRIEELSRSDIGSNMPPPFTVAPVYRTNPIFQHNKPMA